MIAQARVGLVTLVLTFLGGLWIFLAPFIVSYQNDWKTLIDATKNDMWVGGILIAISALTLLLVAAFALRDADREVRRRRAADAAKERASAGDA